MKNWIPHAAALAVIVGCGLLADWQFDRADEKRRILHQWHEREPVALANLSAPFDLPQPVRGVGNWQPERQVLIDNRVRNGRTGVHVLTPWRSDDGRLFLVDRGWAPWPDRTAPLPDPGVTASGTLSGVLNRGPGVGFRLGDVRVPEDPQWPLLVTYFDADALTRALDPDLEPAVIQLDPGHPAHLTGDDWQVVTFGPDRHLGYAMTWISIAVVVALIWATLTVRSLRRRRRD